MNTSLWPSTFDVPNTSNSESYFSTQKLVSWIATKAIRLNAFWSQLSWVLKCCCVLWVSTQVACVVLFVILFQELEKVSQLRDAEQQAIVWCETALSDHDSQEVLTDQTAELITISISGGVKSPGVYQFMPGSRIVDAVQAAGGFSKNVHGLRVSREVNAAAQLVDEQHIYIPVLHDEQATSLKSPSSTAKDNSGTQITAKSQVISINNSSKDEIESLPGIGNVRAQSIIDGRPYNSLNELLERGIVTQKIFDQLNGLISL